jgi:hypothetical protein
MSIWSTLIGLGRGRNAADMANSQRRMLYTSRLMTLKMFTMSVDGFDMASCSECLLGTAWEVDAKHGTLFGGELPEPFRSGTEDGNDPAFAFFGLTRKQGDKLFNQRCYDNVKPEYILDNLERALADPNTIKPYCDYTGEKSREPGADD